MRLLTVVARILEPYVCATRRMPMYRRREEVGLLRTSTGEAALMSLLAARAPKLILQLSFTPCGPQNRLPVSNPAPPRTGRICAPASALYGDTPVQSLLVVALLILLQIRVSSYNVRTVSISRWTR